MLVLKTKRAPTGAPVSWKAKDLRTLRCFAEASLCRTFRERHHLKQELKQVAGVASEETFSRCGSVAAFDKVIVNHRQRLQFAFAESVKAAMVQRQLTIPPFHRRRVFLCSLVKAELLQGAWSFNYSDVILTENFCRPFPSLAFDDDCAEVAGQVRQNLERQGRSIGYMDSLIASVALRYDLVLVTHNTREFSRVAGLIVEDWQI
jgi:tRNA(fMet)-specific endonuclease VapC